MIRRILIIAFVMTPLCFAVTPAGEAPDISNSPSDPAEGCYGDPAWIYAQADDDPEPGWPDYPPFDSQFLGPEGFPGAGPQHLERLRLKKLLELLELDDSQRGKFIELFQVMRINMMSNRQKTKVLVDQLARGLKGGRMADDEIGRLLAEIDSLEVQQLEQMQNLRLEIKDILTPKQLGKFYIFRERFEPRLLKQLGRRRHGMGPGRQFGPDDSLKDNLDSTKH